MKVFLRMMFCLSASSIFVSAIGVNQLRPMTLEFRYSTTRRPWTPVLDPGFVHPYPPIHFDYPEYPPRTLPPPVNYPPHPVLPPVNYPPIPVVPTVSYPLSNTPGPINPSYKYPSIPDSSNQDFKFLETSGFDGAWNFSRKFYQKVAQSNPHESFVVSPFSAYLALLMVSYGARGETERQIGKVIDKPRIDVIQNVFPKALTLLKQLGENSEVNVNNAIYVSKNVGVLERFQETIQSMFKSGVVEINTRNPSQAALQINNWIDEQTNHRITNIVTSGDLQSGDVFLINTIYLRSSWAKEFNTYHTSTKPFYSSYHSQVLVPTMSLTRVYFDTGYLPELHARFVILPYSAPGLEMIVVIPDAIDGLSLIENQIYYIDDDTFSQRRTRTHVNFEMPKFRTESQFRLKNILMNLGMADAFLPGADFSGLSTKGLLLGDVIQKVYIDVDEKGTEAAAVTAAILPAVISAQINYNEKEPELIKVDRPSYFMINYKNINLFSGRIKL